VTGVQTCALPISEDELFEVMGAGRTDVVVVDIVGIRADDDDLATVVSRLRAANPDFRIISVSVDPWREDHSEYQLNIARLVDRVWAPSTETSLLQHPHFLDKVYLPPFPVGIRIDELIPVRREHSAGFQGAVEWYNYSRAFWLSLAAKVGAPLRHVVTKHVDDGLDPISSFITYLSGFRSVAAMVNFSMRISGRRMATGRGFETLFAGICLLQEGTQDMDFYFRAGEHYLAFDTFDEFMDLLTYVRDNPDTADKVARRGQEFYHRTYSDERLIAGLLTGM